jgi:hypothetical protein
MADAISTAIILGSGTFMSYLRIRCLYATLEPAVGGGAGPASFC